MMRESNSRHGDFQSPAIPLSQSHLLLVPYGASGRSRTCDAGIFSPSLYQLSYRGLSQGRLPRLTHGSFYYMSTLLGRYLLPYLPLMGGGRQDLNPPRGFDLALPQSSPPCNKTLLDKFRYQFGAGQNLPDKSVFGCERLYLQDAFFIIRRFSLRTLLVRNQAFIFSN